jgi:hypothetical protein
VLLRGGQDGEDGLELAPLLHHDPVHAHPGRFPGEEGQEVVLDPGLGALNVDHGAGLPLGIGFGAPVGDLGDAHDVGPPLRRPGAAWGVHQGGDHLGGGHHHHVRGQEEVVQPELGPVGGEEEVPHLPEGLPLEVQLHVGQGGLGLGGVAGGVVGPVDEGLEAHALGQGLEDHVQGQGEPGLDLAFRDLQVHLRLEAGLVGKLGQSAHAQGGENQHQGLHKLAFHRSPPAC